MADRMMLFFVKVVLLWTVCVAQLDDISQPVSFQNVKLGDSATVECHIQSEENRRVWYKMTAGMRLQLVATFNPKYNQSQFGDKFRQGYSVNLDRINNHLSIAATTWEDTGTYFCGAMFLNDIEFGSGTLLMMKGSNMISDSVVQHPESQSVQPGDSVTLSCSVQTSLCAEEHTRVTWLKHSPHSAPQMMYSSRYENQTGEGTVTGNATYVYNLLMTNLSCDEDGTYHCVVTACGQILFGNGTRIRIHETTLIQLSPTVMALVMSNIILGIVSLILSWKLGKSRSKNNADAT
ncbi:uncharacterized protein LOC117807101 [Notolabrus celidotus]|uniref:uncharacterized protein LOC117807101 n=1 Tax=Notolabrus celidotus TaxID=1203425 RepID=UPI00149068D9|nr:uncharacterized protein LOC117807101 [Notolabrus celidotus]